MTNSYQIQLLKKMKYEMFYQNEKNTDIYVSTTSGWDCNETPKRCGG